MEQQLHTALAPVVAFLESLSWIGVSSHIVKTPFIDSKVNEIASGLGFELTLMKYTLGLILVYPFSLIMYHLPNKTLKHWWSFLIGFALTQWVFGPDWVHTFLMAAATYLICLLAPKKLQHKLVFWVVMSYMVGAHAYRMYVSYMTGAFDFTGTQMVLTMKLTSFAYNLYDGVADKNNVFPEKPHEDKKKAKLYEDRAQYAIKKLPSPIAFLGYVYCFTCILAGPAFEYRLYEKAIDGTAYNKPTDSESTRRKPNNLLPALFRFAVAVVCLAVHMPLSAEFKIMDQVNLEYIATVHPIVRIGRLLVSLFAYRLKYYFAWKMAEGASVLAGFGFEGYNADGTEKGWRGVENVDIVSLETTANMSGFTRHWNKRTQGWLERYTYHRTGRSLFWTYFVSAVWHGLYPGFYVMFFTFPILTNIERLIKTKFNPLIIPGYDGYNQATYPKTTAANIYWYVCVIVTFVTANYSTQTFVMGTWDNVLVALNGHKYIPHILYLIIWIVLEILPVGGKKSSKSDSEKKSK